MTSHGRAVLGIDAAWTATQPSGGALVIEGQGGWQLAAVQPSYEQFIAAAEGRASDVYPKGSVPDVPAILGACEKLHQSKPSIVAVDMPLSLTPIASRRVSDDLVSRTYGSRHCGTHTPSSTRPGRISDNLRGDFADAGYLLATTEQMPERALVEVYPHPALLELTGAPRRLPYKIAKVRNYWRDAAPRERRELILAVWQEIVVQLDKKISGVAAALQSPSVDAPALSFKAYEDQLDAVICAWVGICVLEGAAVPYGDVDSTIWIPAKS